MEKIMMPIKDLKKAIEIDSSYIEAVNRLGFIYYLIGNEELAQMA